jgi:nicotinamidase-related amidase
MAPLFDPTRTAVLIMDFQNGVVANFKNAKEVMGRVAEVAAGARAAGIRVAYILVRFEEGFPEIGPKSSFKGVKERMGAGLTGQGAQVHPDVAPLPGEAVIAKQRVSAFAGSGLDLYLRSHDIDHLVLMGVATSGVVLSTVRQAFDMDYKLTIISDGCADADDEVQRVLMEKVFARSASVRTAKEFLALL